ncbi:MAG: ion transporter, partial [Alphaproteobacteria bacterium]|nr:ion transporter [Alphaproteobacteria bacterium]
MAGAERGETNRLRRRIDLLLEPGASNAPAARAVHAALTLAILVSVGAMILRSVPQIETQWRGLLLLIEGTAIAIFSVEYALRLWSAPEQKIYFQMSAGRARWLYATSAFGLIDLLSIAPLYLALFTQADFTALLLLRLLRYFKLARYSAGMRSLLEAL